VPATHDSQLFTLEDVLGLISGDTGRAVKDSRAILTRQYRRDLRSNESLRRSWHDHDGPEGYISHLKDCMGNPPRWVFEPLQMWDSPEAQVLVDGHHRAFAAFDAAHDQVPVRVVQGRTWQEMTFEELLRHVDAGR